MSTFEGQKQGNPKISKSKIKNQEKAAVGAFPKIDEAVPARATPCGGHLRPHSCFTLLLHFLYADHNIHTCLFSKKPAEYDVLAVNISWNLRWVFGSHLGGC